MSEVDDFIRLNIGRAAHEALDLIEDLLRKKQEKIDHAAYREIATGNLTPERALALWFSKDALHGLEVSLGQAAKAGTSAGERISKQEDGNG